MWEGILNEPCPLMARLQKIRETIQYVTFVDALSSLSSSPCLPSQDTPTPTCEEDQTSLSVVKINDIIQCQPVCYHDISLASCLFSGLHVKTTMFDSKLQHAAFHSFNPFFSFCKNASFNLTPCCPIVQEECSQTITAMNTCHVLKEHFSRNVYQHVSFMFSKENVKNFLFLALGCSNLTLQLYIVNSAKFNICFGHQNTSLLQTCAPSEAFYLLDTQKLVECLEPSISNSSYINVISFYPLNTIGTKELPFLLLSGTSNGWITLWILQEKAGSQYTFPLQLVPLLSTTIPSYSSEITSILIVDATLTPQGNSLTSSILKLVFVTCYFSGAVYYWTLSVPLHYDSEKILKYLGTGDISSVSGVVSQRRRLWAQDDELGAVLQAKLCISERSCSTDTTMRQVILGIFDCSHGLIILELCPVLQLIDRYIFNPQTCSIVSCLYNSPILTSSIYYQYKEKSLSINTPIINVMISTSQSKDKEKSPDSSLHLVSFFFHVESNEWIQMHRSILPLIDNQLALPFFQRLFYLKEINLLLALDDTGGWWLAFEEKTKQPVNLNYPSFNLAFRQINADTVKRSCPNTINNTLYHVIPTFSRDTSIIVSNHGILLSITRFTSQQLETLWNEQLETFEANCLLKNFFSQHVSVDSVQILISMIFEYFSTLEHQDNFSNPPLPAQSSNHLIDFCESFLNYLYKHSEKKEYPLFFFTQLVSFVNKEYFAPLWMYTNASKQSHTQSSNPSFYEYTTLDEYTLLNLSSVLFEEEEKDFITKTRDNDIKNHSLHDSHFSKNLPSQKKKNISQIQNASQTRKHKYFNSLKHENQDYQVTLQDISIPYWTLDSFTTIHQNLVHVLVSLIICNSLICVAEALSFVLPHDWLTTGLPPSFSLLLSRLFSNIDVLQQPSSLLLVQILSHLNCIIVTSITHLASTVLFQGQFNDISLMHIQQKAEDSHCVALFSNKTSPCTLFASLLFLHTYDKSMDCGLFDMSFIINVLKLNEERILSEFLGYYFVLHRHPSFILQISDFLLDKITCSTGELKLTCCVFIILHLLQHTRGASNFEKVCKTADDLLQRVQNESNTCVEEIYLWKAYLLIPSWSKSSPLAPTWCQRVIHLLLVIPITLKEEFELFLLTCFTGQEELLKTLMTHYKTFRKTLPSPKDACVNKLPKLTLCLARKYTCAFEVLSMMDRYLLQPILSDPSYANDACLSQKTQFLTQMDTLISTFVWFFTEYIEEYPKNYSSHYILSILLYLNHSPNLWNRYEMMFRKLHYQLQLSLSKQILHSKDLPSAPHSITLFNQPCVINTLRILFQYEQLVNLNCRLYDDTAQSLTNKLYMKKHQGFLLKQKTVNSLQGRIQSLLVQECSVIHSLITCNTRVYALLESAALNDNPPNPFMSTRASMKSVANHIDMQHEDTFCQEENASHYFFSTTTVLAKGVSL